MATSNEEYHRDSQAVSALIRWHGYAALVSVLYVALLGLMMSIKFHARTGSAPFRGCRGDGFVTPTPKGSSSAGSATRFSLSFTSQCPGWLLDPSRAHGSAG